MTRNVYNQPDQDQPLSQNPFDTIVSQQGDPFEKASKFYKINQCLSPRSKISKYELQFNKTVKQTRQLGRMGILSPRHDPELHKNLRQIFLELELKSPPMEQEIDRHENEQGTIQEQS